MKYKNILSIIFIVTLSICFLSFTAEKLIREKTEKGMPDEIKAAFDKSCYGCHNSDTGGQRAFDKLDLKKLDSLPRVQKIAKLKSIDEAVKNGEMPPERFLEKNPDKKLTSDEVKKLHSWIVSETKKLLKK
jgi:mono/diheme cytochrome c family protein